ncbi:MAG: hypothetical protein V4665_00110 [Patescibacteria group bacterium]
MTKAKAITNDIVQNSITQRMLFRILVSGIIVLSLVYVYLIGSITFNILARKTLETSVRALGSRVSELELSYLNASNKIDKTYAASKGFVDIHKNIFATRDDARVALR